MTIRREGGCYYNRDKKIDWFANHKDIDTEYYDLLIRARETILLNIPVLELFHVNMHYMGIDVIDATPIYSKCRIWDQIKEERRESWEDIHVRNVEDIKFTRRNRYNEGFYVGNYWWRYWPDLIKFGGIVNNDRLWDLPSELRVWVLRNTFPKHPYIAWAFAKCINVTDGYIGDIHTGRVDSITRDSDITMVTLAQTIWGMYTNYDGMILMPTGDTDEEWRRILLEISKKYPCVIDGRLHIPVDIPRRFRDYEIVYLPAI
jgi:hypothetical protein